MTIKSLHAHDIERQKHDAERIKELEAQVNDLEAEALARDEREERHRHITTWLAQAAEAMAQELMSRG